MPEGARRTSEGRGGKATKLRPPADRFFTFVLTDGAGAHYYGGCLERHFRSGSGGDGTFLPRSTCVLSRVPAFSAFRDVLARLHVLTGGEAPLAAAAVSVGALSAGLRTRVALGARSTSTVHER